MRTSRDLTRVIQLGWAELEVKPDVLKPGPVLSHVTASLVSVLKRMLRDGPPGNREVQVRGPALPLSRSRGTGHPALPFTAQSSVKEGALHPLQRCGEL